MTSSTSGISFTGLASGLNTTALVQNVLRYDQQNISTLQTKVTSYQSQQSSLQGIQSDLQALQTAASQLGASQGSVFQSVTATSSNTGILTAAAGTGAQTGTTNLQVLALAQSSQIASQGYASANSSITEGTIQVSSGSNSSTITINSTNNTLSGLATAINNAGIGVTASVVDTGSGDADTQPYRLLLSANNTGTANAIQITNNLAASASGATQPNFSTSVIGPAVTGSSFSGTSAITSSGTYAGSANDQYTFTIANGGTVGTDNGIEVDYTNSTGTETGTLTLDATDANTPVTVADGVQVSFGTGTLTTGDSFTVNTFTPTVQAAANSEVQLGSGAGAITVQNSSNILTNLIPGVTLSLQSAAVGQTVQIAIANDVSTISTAITNFVDDYNTFSSDLATDTSYKAGTGTAAGTAGPLNGYTSLVDIQNQVEQQLLSTVGSLPAAMNSLSALGISVGSTGQLSVNTTQLDSALSGGISGITINDVKNLFSLQGQSSSQYVQFSTGGSNTQPSGATPYTVNITQAATEASVTGSTSLASSTVINSSNDTLSLNVNGYGSGTITLTDGTYTEDQLAQQLESQINSAIASNGNSVTVSVSNGNLSISSNVYGSASQLSGLSGTALSTLGYTGSETSAGQDVKGSFVVNGVTEAATGTGQILTGNSGNANTDGLTVVVSYTPSQVSGSGTQSTLAVTQGLASSLSNTIQGLLNTSTGEITGIANQITQNITSAQSDITTQTAAMDAQQTNLMSQFAALEVVMENLQQTSSLLTSALANSNSSGSSSSSTPSSTVDSTIANSQMTTTTS